ncbi:4-hydroxyphenylpyruvate dioxygenase [Pyrus ussuriensis x Pyrus communis]|uniref:4-hydroxyphenylpyruvate dioxygenase n=1 Tax=Pyrus ussuriensis x Pyrus communis TaxID=2448454 RepID=A0A5N5GDX9_9ROSA|nr:4-hydroxyphenylpyruvate dioxygenase [Pyrus ussuriensis x Pyrus communis]
MTISHSPPAATTTTTTATATSSTMGQENDTQFNLVGFSNFVRTNPRSDRFQVHRFHYVEFWCTDATNAALQFSWGLGMPMVGKSDLSTGNQTHASYPLRSGDLVFLFTAPYSPTLTRTADPARPRTTASIPTFDHSASRAFSATHGLGVRAVANQVEDAVSAFTANVAHGVQLYGDVVLRYVSYTDHNHLTDPDPNLWFLPGFESLTSSFPIDFGIRRLDHAVGNVEDLKSAVSYVKGFTGFHEFAEFTAEDVGTSESGLNSVVLANNEEMVLFPMNEPVYGRKRKSQIQTYLEHNEGAGVQHLALVSEDILRTLREMRSRSGVGGFQFMPAPPPTYYRNLKKRVGDVLTDKQIKECEELGILVDRDDQETLPQIFTKPVGDRPTIFVEIIQRVGCTLKDEEGKVQQKGGYGGFRKGNFSELFKSIEEYKKMLEAKQIAEPAAA